MKSIKIFTALVIAAGVLSLTSCFTVPPQKTVTSAPTAESSYRPSPADAHFYEVSADSADWGRIIPEFSDLLNSRGGDMPLDISMYDRITKVFDKLGFEYITSHTANKEPSKTLYRDDTHLVEFVNWDNSDRVFKLIYKEKSSVEDAKGNDIEVTKEVHLEFNTIDFELSNLEFIENEDADHYPCGLPW